MSSDVGEGYKNNIKKLVQKVRSLVTCFQIDFWTVDLIRNILTCEVSQSLELQDKQIPCDMETILGPVAITGQYIKIDNNKLDSCYHLSQLQYSNGQSILVLPIRVENGLHPIGVIQAINKISSQDLSNLVK
jgi:hypothetical protein